MGPVISIGEPAPPFQLTDLLGNIFSLSDMRGWIVMLNFWSAECTWCERVDHELTSHLDEWKDGVKVWWVASNANESRDLIVSVAAERNIPVVLLDTHQQVADRYGAETTPHLFVVDRHGMLAYQGAWDDITFRRRVATQVYIPQVIHELMNDSAPKITQTQPYGCALVRLFGAET